jgi:hypothetical protein
MKRILRTRCSDGFVQNKCNLVRQWRGEGTGAVLITLHRRQEEK